MTSDSESIGDIFSCITLYTGMSLHVEVRDKRVSILADAPPDQGFRYAEHMAFGSLGELYVEVADVDKLQTPRHAARYRFQSSRGDITIWLATSNDALWLADLFDDFAQTMYSAVPRELL